MANLFSTPDMPAVKPAVPLPDEAQLKKSRRRRIAKESKTAGQTSTVLSTGGKETLGA